MNKIKLKSHNTIHHLIVILLFKGPKGEAVGSITQPLPSSYLIIRATSESDGK